MMRRVEQVVIQKFTMLSAERLDGMERATKRSVYCRVHWFRFLVLL